MEAEHSERKAIIREATGLSLASYLFLLITVLRSFFIASFLGPTLYGVWNIFKTFLDAGNFAAAGAGQAVAREIPFNKAQGNDQHNQLIIRSTIGLCLLSGLVLALATLVFSCFDVAAGYRIEIRICAIAFVLNAVHLYIPNQLKGEKKIYLLSVYYISYASLNCVFGLLLLLYWGISGLLIGMIIANVVLISWLLSRGHLLFPWPFRWDIGRSLIGIGFPMLFVAIAPRLMASLDKLIIFWLLGSTATGYYSMAVFFSETINYIPLVLATVLFPRLMYQKGKGVDLTEMGYLYDKPLVLLASLIPVLLGLLILNIGVAIRYLLPEYLPAVPILKILIAGLFFNVIWSVPKNLLEIFDKQSIFLSAIPLFLLLGTALNFAMIQLGFGIVGVAYASVLFYFMVSLTANLYALHVMQKSYRQVMYALAEIHLPFVYGVTGLLLLQRYLTIDSELWESLLRSLIYLVYCLPLILRADRKLKLFGSLRVALFKSV
jgi:O-antigen/teichoic acid export membrane protein